MDPASLRGRHSRIIGYFNYEIHESNPGMMGVRDGPRRPRGRHSRIIGYFNYETHEIHESNLGMMGVRDYFISLLMSAFILRM